MLIFENVILLPLSSIGWKYVAMLQLTDSLLLYTLIVFPAILSYVSINPFSSSVNFIASPKSSSNVRRSLCKALDSLRILAQRIKAFKSASLSFVGSSIHSSNVDPIKPSIAVSEYSPSFPKNLSIVVLCDSLSTSKTEHINSNNAIILAL